MTEEDKKDTGKGKDELSETWREVGKQLQNLGEAFADAVKTSIDSDEGRERAEKVKATAEVIVRDISDAVKKAAKGKATGTSAGEKASTGAKTAEAPPADADVEESAEPEQSSADEAAARERAATEAKEQLKRAVQEKKEAAAHGAAGAAGLGKGRAEFAFGLALFLLGVAFLVLQFAPGLFSWLVPERVMAGPAILLFMALFFFILGIVNETPGLMVPASLFGGIGGLLAWQGMAGGWETWSYAWTLIPGFIGFGILLMRIFGGGDGKSVNAALWLMGISALLFSFFGVIFGGLAGMGLVWPILLIAAGLLFLVRSLMRASDAG